MELCLYDPEYGYYSRHANQFGKAGDFYTSSDIHAVFGRLMARQFEQMWRVMDTPSRIEVKELGPGRGLFAEDVLDWSEKKFPDFFQALHYVLVESSPKLHESIQRTLARHLENGKATLVPALEMHGENEARPAEIIFANEFFDALPVEILSCEGALRIGLQDGRLSEFWAAPSSEELEFLDRYSVHPEPGERLEVPLKAQELMDKAARIDRGFILAIDYGYTRPEQLAGRHRGTLKAIRQHSVSANPYEAPGEQDLTSDVNFTALGGILEKCGVRAEKLITQSQFLMGIGEENEFADAFEDCRLPKECAKVALQLKHLVTPAGMGESFHVLIGSKAVDHQRVKTLGGLRFAAPRLER